MWLFIHILMEDNFEKIALQNCLSFRIRAWGRIVKWDPKKLFWVKYANVSSRCSIWDFSALQNNRFPMTPTCLHISWICTNSPSLTQQILGLSPNHNPALVSEYLRLDLCGEGLRPGKKHQHHAALSALARKASSSPPCSIITDRAIVLP